MKTQNIFVNQIGYFSNESKFAYVRANVVTSETDKSFFIKDDCGKQVFSGKLIAAPQDELTGEEIFSADFSNFSQTGKFVICVGNEESFPIEICNGKSDAYEKLYYSSLKYFYLSRCGQNIDGGEWSHSACHTGVAEVYGTWEEKTVVGGWHDAGDYGRYIVAGAKTVMDLLLAYEACPEYSKFDILAEVRFELEWMLQLQREDGAVYHKISCYHFCGFINPDEEKDKLVIAPVSTAATADFAGCLAFASTFYKKSDADFADKLLSAAIKAQKYLDEHSDELYKNPQEITTGGYGDFSVKDERYFALCSLFAVTENPEFLNKALEVKKQALAMPEDKEHSWGINWLEAFGWSTVAGYGTEILLKNQPLIKKVAGEELIAEFKEAIISRAEKILELCKKRAFKIGNEFMFWGSNGYVCDESHLLLLAYDISKKTEYLEAAKNQLDYILGCNPMNYCYVTGNGSKAPENAHHRPSGFVKKIMPGMLAGGPATGLHDAVAKEKLVGKPPLQCYIDDVGSYSTNEVAIYWNSALVYVIAKLGLV